MTTTTGTAAQAKEVWAKVSAVSATEAVAQMARMYGIDQSAMTATKVSAGKYRVAWREATR